MAASNAIDDWLLIASQSLDGLTCRLSEPDEVHIWRFGLDVNASQLVELERCLSQDEQNRVAKLHTAQLRSRFIAGRGLMRRVLGRYLSCVPEAITFHYGPHGKPLLANIDGSLQFNLAHSQGRALLVVALQPVGIDMEFIRTDLDIEAMASLVFTSAEQTALRQATRENRFRHFYTTWVRKEAYMKAMGHGLSENPARFAMVVDQGGIAVQYIDGIEVTPWVIHDLSDQVDNAAALATAGSMHPRFNFFDLR